MIIDLIFVLNTVFDIVIVGMGYWAYRKGGNRIPAYIGYSLRNLHYCESHNSSWICRNFGNCFALNTYIYLFDDHICLV